MDRQSSTAAPLYVHRAGDPAAAVAATQGALEQTQYRYEGGLVTYLEVVVSENAALAARLSAVNIQVRRMTASVSLVKALGGGWETPITTSLVEYRAPESIEGD